MKTLNSLKTNYNLNLRINKINNEVPKEFGYNIDNMNRKSTKKYTAEV